jgi:RHS repeat-associated protein
VSGIAAGPSFAVVVQGTGGVLTWGQGSSGQLGNNASQGKTTPVVVVGVNGSGTLGGQTLIAAGNAYALAIATTRTITTSYGYDKLYRLTSGGTPGMPNSYAYDPVGNRLALTQGFATPTAYTYDKADRILTVGGQIYTVDNDGNLTAYPSATLAYDQANRLKTFVTGGTTTTYAYDGDSKRASKTVGSTSTSYAYDVNRSLPVVLTDGTLKYVWGNGLAYATNTSGAVRNVYHTDGLGSVRAITDATGNVSQTYQTDEFGVPSLTQGTNPQPFRFTGEQRDSESGFEYLRAGYYAPTLGRFVTRDPVFGGLDPLWWTPEDGDSVDLARSGGPVNAWPRPVSGTSSRSRRNGASGSSLAPKGAKELCLIHANPAANAVVV